MKYNGHTITCTACKPRRSLKEVSARAKFAAMKAPVGMMSMRRMQSLILYLRARLRFEAKRNDGGK